jgi:ribosome-associated protein
MSSPLVVSPDCILPAGDLTWTAVRASGPGGQNVNKVASKVELRFDLEGTTALSPAVKERLTALAASRLDAEGNLVVSSQATRDQQRNLEDARQKLSELVKKALHVAPRRKPTRPGRGARERRLSEKKSHAAKKASRKISAD